MIGRGRGNGISPPTGNGEMSFPRRTDHGPMFGGGDKYDDFAF